MPNEQSNLSEFFKNSQEPLAPAGQAGTQDEGLLPDELKNRHIRRLETKLQNEREANIASAARIEALSEAQKLRESTTTVSWEEKARRIYGNDKPENAAASDLLVESIREATLSARKEALEEIRRDVSSRQQAQDKESNVIKGYIEQVEDQYGVDLTSTPEAQERQKQFRELWVKLSPKDSDGKVRDYADPIEAYEIFKGRQADPAKEYASHGMTRSQPTQTASQDDATTKYLRDNGILDPF